MIIRDKKTISTIINNTPEGYYPFHVSEVSYIYTKKIGGGEGIWFRLIDSSIWNSSGVCLENARDADFDQTLAA